MEKVRVDYYSFQYHVRARLNKSRLYGELAGGLGLIKYYNDGKLWNENFSLEGKTYGMNASLCFDYIIHRNISLFVSSSLFLANLNEQTRNGFTEKLNPKESLSRIDCNGGIRISLYTTAQN